VQREKRRIAAAVINMIVMRGRQEAPSFEYLIGEHKIDLR
jgi:hypothetical protein